MSESGNAEGDPLSSALLTTIVTEDSQEAGARTSSESNEKLQAHVLGAAHSQHHPTEAPTKLSKADRQSLFKLWAWEVVAELAAFCGLIAIAAVCWHYNGKYISKWPYQFTLNSLIALLATWTKAALLIPVIASIGQRKWLWFISTNLDPATRRSRTAVRRFGDFECFDKASRSSFDSLQLIYSLSLRDLATLGAVITLLSPLFSTLVQNLLTTKIRSDPGHILGITPGLVPRAEIYEHFTAGANMVDPQPSLPMQAAIYSGAISSNVTNLPLICPTGNCTWPGVIPSLGVCGACVNVMPQVQQNCEGPPKDNKSLIYDSGCEYSIPGGLSLNTHYSNQSAGTNVDKRCAFTVGLGIGQIWKNRTAGLHIANFGVLGEPQKFYDTGKDPTLDAKLQNLMALDCGLWWCVQAYSVNISLGTTVESVTDTWGEATSLYDTDLWKNFSNIPSHFNTAPGTKFMVGLRSAMSLSFRMEDLLIGKVFSDAGPEINYGSLDSAAIIQAMWAAAHDMEGWLHRLTLSLSNVIRSTGSISEAADGTKYVGIAHVDQVIFHVAWAWITFPAALIILSTLFLIVTMIESSNATRVPLWKNSATALLYTKLDQNLHAEASDGLDSGQDIEQLLKARRVRLEQEDGAVVFYPGTLPQEAE